MSLRQQVLATLSPSGGLSAMVPGFLPRPGQTEMALAIARKLLSGGALVVEAGTGVGKTFSYLIPALLSGKRVMVSTATKNLQDQLFGRDLPLLVKAMGIPVKTALLKGRSSYLCRYRLEIAREEVPHTDRIATKTLATIERWAQATVSGDMAELPGLDERSPLLPLVTSTRENCLGSQCPKYANCHVNQARREALGADIVVINHHLFFADLAVRESGMAELLPTVNAVIFDEAHQLNEIGVQFLGRILSTSQLLDFTRDLLANGLTLARGLAPWQDLAKELDGATRDLRMLVGQRPPNAKLRWLGEAPESLHPGDWSEALQRIVDALQVIQSALALLTEVAPEFKRLQERQTDLATVAKGFLEASATGTVRWLDVSAQHLRVVESPLDIGETVQRKLLKSEEPEADEKCWVFTSATLGDDARLTWFTEPCGLQKAEVLQVESPFDYATQAAVYVPRHLPKPNEANHSQELANLVAQAVRVIGGRTLVLTTTLRALRAVSDALLVHFNGSDLIEILVQGQGSKKQLTERFREGAGMGRPGCVLVASASFWEGVDVPGDALQLVVIDKLPFPPPNDPLVEARTSRLAQEGRSGFNDYFLPEAAVALKQGAGRLIRRESDQGILVVGDVRMATMGYGRRILAALPAMKKLASPEEFQAALVQLTKSSTKDFC